ncbi:MAG: PbsX family transcriptional regulator [Betaproteobacteria bacterium HGW-Betaproteobacteria-3]|jgi:antitoxin MazE|nr:MAG: PbsX family transcriptional regulator [Betaproteobacteria bacterium HGW-Betaproteobacteria-3]
MAATPFHTSSIIKPWGNGLGLRLTKAVAQASGVAADTPVRVTVARGRITIEAETRPLSLKDMLQAFDPSRHGGEAMAFKPLGAEIL